MMSDSVTRHNPKIANLFAISPTDRCIFQRMLRHIANDFRVNDHHVERDSERRRRLDGIRHNFVHKRS